jgi:hypothetical protein
MERQQLKKLLGQLRDELEKTDQLDQDLLDMAADVDAQLHRITQEEDHQPAEDLGDLVDKTAANFAVNHPRAEAILRELADILGKMGI